MAAGLAISRRLGAAWLTAELVGLSTRARLGADRPRAKQVGDLGADGVAGAAAAGGRGTRAAGGRFGPSGRGGPAGGAGGAGGAGAGAGRDGATRAGRATGAGSGGGTGPVDADPFGLTPRERQVLALLARGATNREIGVELYMAEKTASVHVSRILAKLDVRGRTQAAAVAHRLALVVDEPVAS